MLHALLSTIGPDWLWHPLGQCVGTHAEVMRCKSYNFWSGSFSDVGEITLVTSAIALVIGFFHHLECHEEKCHRHGKYVIEGGVRCCDLHHPALDKRPHRGRGKVHALHQKHLGYVRKHGPA